MNEKQSELAIILNEIYIQTKQCQDIKIESLVQKTVDRMHKEKLEFIKTLLNIKLMSTVRHGTLADADILRKKIEIFEEMG